MRTQYFCSDARRRQEVAEATSGLNGIDYLEVLDRDYVAMLGEVAAQPLRQRTLLVHCLKPLPADLDEENVNIEGGVRITGIQVEWAGRASAAADMFSRGLILAEERDYFLALPKPDRILVVRTDSRGDFSTYRLSLVASNDVLDPPAGFDELLSQVDFSFKVECPSEFDCKIERVCPPEPADEPVIDYLAKDYASFRRLILDRLSVIMPEWQERNAADLGVTLVELLAYAGDRLSYYQDAVGAEAYLGTARRRASVRRHARLLDYRMHDGCNARAWVAIEVNSGGDGMVLRKTDQAAGTPVRLLTRVAGNAVLPAEDLDGLLATHRPEVFELMHDVLLYQAHNEMRLYTWQDRECCLPKGATQATLVDDAGARLRLRVGDVVIFEERLDPGTGQAADADPRHRHAVRLTRVEPQAEQNEDGSRTPTAAHSDPLTGHLIVRVEWDAADALPFALCISKVFDGKPVDVSVVRGNVVLADHGRTMADDDRERPNLSPNTVPPESSQRRYRPRLSRPGVTFRTDGDETTVWKRAASKALPQDPREALPAVELVDDEDERWTPRRDLLDSGRFDPHFVVESESDGVAQLRFARADDQSGKTPAAGTKFQATYRVGNGTCGNVGAESIAHLVVQDVNALRDVRRVRNPISAGGGVDPESAERVRLDAPQAFRIQQRAVTDRDYADVAQRHPEVQKAVATRRWTGSWHTMFLTVDRRDGLPVDAGFREELIRFLERFRLAGHDLEVESPRYVPLEIVMTVCVAPGHFASDVKRALLDRFSNRDLPDGRRGFFHPDNFTFGQAVFLSRLISAAMEIPGVLWVDLTDRGVGPNRFRRFGDPSHGEFDEGRIDMDRLEIARLDNDPSLPENGKLEFLMEGGA